MSMSDEPRTNFALRSPLLVAALVFASLFSFPVFAEPSVTWYLFGATFTDGGTATGSFTYNSGSVISYDITTSATGVLIPFSGHHYLPADSGVDYSSSTPGYSELVITNDIPWSSPTIRIVSLGNYSVSGPDLPLSLSYFEWDNVQALFTGRQWAAGAVSNASPVSVPETGTIALFGIALAGLGFSRRRRQKTAQLLAARTQTSLRR